MEPDRATLANIDRKVLSRLGRDETYRMVRLPVSDALWATWKRYCHAAGIPIGRAVVALIAQELRTVVDESDDAPIFDGRAEERLAAREARLAARERELTATEQRLRGWDERLRTREADLQARVQRLEMTSRLAWQRGTVRKVGRNERCPCGSGLKYKHCHGLGGDREGRVGRLSPLADADAADRTQPTSLRSRQA